MDEFDGRGELVVARTRIVEQPGRCQRQHRPHPLSAAGNQVAGQFGDQRNLRLHPFKDDSIDVIHFSRNEVDDGIKRRLSVRPDAMKRCRHDGHFSGDQQALTQVQSRSSDLQDATFANKEFR